VKPQQRRLFVNNLRTLSTFLLVMAKALLLTSLWLSLCPRLAAATGDQERDRLKESGQVMKEILGTPEDIPQNLLNKAECVIVLPSVKKVAVGIGGSYGRGVMTCRGGADFDGPWSTPTMMESTGGNFGLQIGGQATDFVILVVNPRGARNMMHSKVKLGADASVAAGPKGRDASAATTASMQAEMLSYSRSRGVFGGVSLEGSTLKPDGGANENLYGKEVSAEDIIVRGAVPTPAEASLLLSTLTEHSPRNVSASK
jgi:lipid-binding SYLF domain-containing protein